VKASLLLGPPQLAASFVSSNCDISFWQIALKKSVFADARRFRCEVNCVVEMERIIAEARRNYQPAYIAVPSDYALSPVVSADVKPIVPGSNEATLKKAMAIIAERINKAKSIVASPAFTISRLGLQKEAQKAIEALGCPFVTTLMEKCVIGESHPQFAGMYAGAVSEPKTRQIIEGADLVLDLGGVNLNDITTAAYSGQLDLSRFVTVGLDHVRIGDQVIANVRLEDILSELAKLKLSSTPHKGKPRGLAQVLPSGRKRLADIQSDVLRAAFINTLRTLTLCRDVIKTWLPTVAFWISHRKTSQNQSVCSGLWRRVGPPEPIQETRKAQSRIKLQDKRSGESGRNHLTPTGKALPLIEEGSRAYVAGGKAISPMWQAFRFYFHNTRIYATYEPFEGFDHLRLCVAYKLSRDDGGVVNSENRNSFTP
jgi:TPP-dependent 2-oxoacid decarboxylase